MEGSRRTPPRPRAKPVVEIIRGYRDPVLKVGGSVGILKRMEFLETGQLELASAGADRGGGGSLRASGRKLRKDLFAKLKGKKKYKAGMTKPKKPPVLPEIRFPSDAETYKPWVRYVSEAGEPYWFFSCVFFPVSTPSTRPRLRRAATPPARRRRDAYYTVDGTAGTTPRRMRRRGTSRLNIFPAQGRGARHLGREAARAQAKKAKRQAHRRRLAAAPTVGDEPALMDALSPIATTPEARSRQLRALKPAIPARRAATPRRRVARRDAPAVQSHERRRHGRALRPPRERTPVRRSSARSSRASSTPGEDLPARGGVGLDLVFSFVPTSRHRCPGECRRSKPHAGLPPIVADPAAEARKKRALRKARKAAAASRASTSGARRSSARSRPRARAQRRRAAPTSRATCPEARAEPVEAAGAGGPGSASSRSSA